MVGPCELCCDCCDPTVLRTFRLSWRYTDQARWALSQLDDDGLRSIAGVADIRPDPRDPNPKLVFEPRMA